MNALFGAARRDFSRYPLAHGTPGVGMSADAARTSACATDGRTFWASTARRTVDGGAGRSIRIGTIRRGERGWWPDGVSGERFRKLCRGFCFSILCKCRRLRAGTGGTGSFLLSKRSTSHYGRLMNVARRDPVSDCPLQGVNIVRHRTSPRNRLLLGGRAALFRFQSNAQSKRRGRAARAKRLKTGGKHFSQGR